MKLVHINSLYVVWVRENAWVSISKYQIVICPLHIILVVKNGSLTKGTIVEISEFKAIEDGSLWGNWLLVVMSVFR